ncbi:MAG: hypothetical protein IJC48_10670 [Clostridia bacterium]|nr:hypothetical protein [Clostridia bacterium]
MIYADGIHDDSLGIQELLNKCGTVSLDAPGVYAIGRTLKIHSNTRFVLSPGVHLLAMENSKCALIENEHFACGGRDMDIEIIGGIWDGNCDRMGLDPVYEAIHREDEKYSPNLFKGKLMRFAHIDRLSIEKLTVRNPVSYGIQIAGANGFLVRDIYFDYNWHFGTTDGVHINGPSQNGVIENLFGTTNDDMVSLTTVDESHAEITKGEISCVEIRNISARNGYSGIRLLSAGDYDMRSIHIDGVYGDYRHNAVLISQHNTRPNTRTWFDDITVARVNSVKSETELSEDCFTYWDGANQKLPIVWIETGINAGSIILRDITRHEAHSSKSLLVKIDEGAYIKRLIMENIFQTAGEGVIVPFIENKGEIEKLIIRDVDN